MGLSVSNAGSALVVVCMRMRPPLNRTRVSAANVSAAAIQRIARRRSQVDATRGRTRSIAEAFLRHLSAAAGVCVYRA